MSAPVWVLALADTFWEAAGARNIDLRVAIVRALPLTSVSLPQLRVSEIDAWLSKQGVPCAIRERDRALRACLVAHADCGAIFVDADDSEEEQRFSLAHELAHFLHDYWEPRRLAAERLGSNILDVFDRKRAPETSEQIHALLAKVPIGFHVHLMERSQQGNIDDPAVAEAERNADLLAFELLAPEEEIFNALDGTSMDNRRAAAEHILQEQYGLPASSASRYADLLVPPSMKQSLLIRKLFPVQ